ncbi:Mitochondrial porin, variant 2 [Entomophthora muscae]|uniref:Mitochondrial porin n=2 Tax=Entomophthora muscae TaxID=34485 RepID=A0ACC2T3R6_9FUNG|nr:Mitochondrial porin [Entomophthora muscae]KAJ9069259.1 Mitochondrial porin, variant 2 [Entomophthora muscae]
MAPVAFPDLSKAVKDLLTKDYPVGQAKLEVKTLTSNGVNLTINGHQDVKSGFVFGEGKVKYSDYTNGLVITNAITTSNLLTTQIELENKAAKGIKLDILAGYLPMTSQKNLKANIYYKHDLAHVRVAADVFKGPQFNLDFVAGQDGVYLGGETAYDVEKGNVTKYNASVAYMHRDFTAALHSTDSFGNYAGTFYQRVNSDVEVGVRAAWDSKAVTSAVNLELGTKYALDRDAFIKAKVDNQGKLGLAYTQLVKPGVKLSLGGAFDTTKLNEPAHKIGFSLLFEN